MLHSNEGKKKRFVAGLSVMPHPFENLSKHLERDMSLAVARKSLLFLPQYKNKTLELAKMKGIRITHLCMTLHKLRLMLLSQKDGRILSKSPISPVASFFSEMPEHVCPGHT